MKKLTAILIILTVLVMPFTALAEQEEIPSLVSISFNNADINEEIEQDVSNYTLTLKNTNETPTLKSYEIKGSGELFVNYKLDSANRQTGILVTIRYVGGNVEYNFDYSNVTYDTKSGNNLLSEINCPNGEVYPKVNDKDVNYKLFIPSDLTELHISTVTKDINAYCNFPGEISLSEDQEPEFTLTVTAANGETRAYKLKIKRVDKSTDEIADEIKNEGKESIVNNEVFFKNPAFLVVAGAALGGIIFIVGVLAVIKRITVKPEDSNEKEFFEDE